MARRSIPAAARVLLSVPAGALGAWLRPSARSVSGFVAVVSGSWAACASVAAAWAPRLPARAAPRVRPSSGIRGLFVVSVPVRAGRTHSFERKEQRC